MDEVLMKFHAEVKIELQWKDPRITFKNLAKDGNFLSEFWQDQIWLPPVRYSNSEANLIVSDADAVVLEVLRHGMGEPNSVTDLYEGYTFKGEENELYLFSWHEGYFYCLLELSEFPFDIQQCSVNLKIPVEIQNYTTFQPKMGLDYSGTYFQTISMFSKVTILCT